MQSEMKYVIEFIGTFVFLSVILRVTSADSKVGNLAPLAIVLALLTAIYFDGGVSGGHFNPAVSVMMHVKDVLNNGSPDMVKTLGYIASQVLGGLGALQFSRMM